MPKGHPYFRFYFLKLLIMKDYVSNRWKEKYSKLEKFCTKMSSNFDVESKSMNAEMNTLKSEMESLKMRCEEVKIASATLEFSMLSFVFVISLAFAWITIFPSFVLVERTASSKKFVLAKSPIVICNRAKKLVAKNLQHLRLFNFYSKQKGFENSQQF